MNNDTVWMTKLVQAEAIIEDLRTQLAAAHVLSKAYESAADLLVKQRDEARGIAEKLRNNMIFDHPIRAPYTLPWERE